MKLSRESLKNTVAWQKSGIEIPKFDVDAMLKKTASFPEWVHFGAGNIFRGFMSACHQELLEAGTAETGIIAVETFDEEIIDNVYRKYDMLTLNVLADADGSLDMKVIASIGEAIVGNPSRTEEWNRLVWVFQQPSLKMVTFTITEKGYAVRDSARNFLGVIQSDIENGLEAPIHVMSRLVALMHKRYLAGKYPVALVSTDNCAKNGEKLCAAVLTIAEAWLAKGYVEEGFVAYLKDGKTVSFPWSMIDRITPRPSEDIQKAIEAKGVENMGVVVTSKNTYIAPFVNSEVSQYLFIEDDFPNGRFPLEKAKGIWLTDRVTVNKIETMKVTTCLNPLHTAIAIVGWLLGYTMVFEAVKDKDISRLVERIGYVEGLPVVVDPEIISPKEFLDEVFYKRFTNPYIPDTTMRIATDTSQKVGIRFGETIKSYVENETLKIEKLTGISLAIAAWCRYLLAVDDVGKSMNLSPDPMLEELQAKLGGATLGGPIPSLSSILSNVNIFGSDLYAIGMGERIQNMFGEMLTGPGAVRATLKKYLG
ncbi:Mannitol dehydrogenase domain [Ruminiclostridium papyrosolvens DSM 2782]|uniref:Mannitol dehydrogenase domain n=1 Tax=Ruminiclostridium papyrosolvens DSM 2782 TaxID=588581 RepID=F1TF85_9FIRM|nr:mannitol dehydrogenase family protein [Ruminiclostridium papyrosolvens]EGD47023.1 Mannitol dehydrogenase domain [Ruminiclostridium papyrosolvens DSM 2782]WES33728.1 mannitol dehydrogenase family protein [Ruminiclostridium papyrosolvens DSM 2782]